MSKVFVRLSDKAASFDSPISNVGVIPGKATEIAPASLTQDPHIKEALQYGHLIQCNESEATAYEKKWADANKPKEPAKKNTAKDAVPPVDPNAKKEGDEGDEDDEEYTKEELEKMTKAELLELVDELELDEEDVTVNDKSTKEAIIAFYLDNQ